MTFYTYMTRNYLNEDSPAGDSCTGYVPGERDFSEKPSL